MKKKLVSLLLALMLVCVSAMALAADEYQITFHPNSGSGEMAGATVPAGGSYTLPECGFTPPEGTVFSHWMTEGHPKLMPENTITVNSDLTILPAWVEEQYTIVLDPNLGDGKTYSETYQHDEEFYLPNGEEADLPFTVPEGKIIWNWVLLETGDDFEPGMSFVGRDGMVFRADWADAEWQENSYSVRLVVGEWAEERTSPVGTEFMLPNLRQLPCRNDFGEDAWIDYWTVDGVKYAPGSRLVLAQDTIATATLGEESTVVYMVMFSANGGSGSRIPMEVSAGTAIILPENPYTAPEGKQFKAWQIGTQQYAAGDSVTVTGEMTVSAVWETKVCKVTFDLNGVEGSYPVQEVEYGKQYTLPEPDAIVEVPENLNFKGWKIGGNTYSPNSPITVTEDITVVAQWSERLVSITYLNDDGEEIKVIGDLAYGTEHEELTPEAVGLTVPDGYVFDYWQVLNTRLEVIDTAYVGDDKPLVLYSNWLMKAVWKAAEVAETYTVTYDPGRGTGEIKTETATAGEKFPLINPSQLGYTAPEGEAFKAWSINGVEYPMHEFIDVTEDITATALWEAGECTVSFDANGGTGTMAPVTMAKGAEFTVPACGFTAPTGKQFKVWTIDDNEVKPDLVITPISDLTLKAVWEDAPVAQYTISFDANGGTGTMADVTHTADGAYTLPYCEFVKEGHNFGGWLVNGEGEPLEAYATIEVSADTELVAYWVAQTYNIMFSPGIGEENDDEHGETVEKKYGEAFALPQASEYGFTCEGHTFAGWKDETNGADSSAVILKAGEMFTPTAFTILVAQWEKLEYTVNFLPGMEGGVVGTGTMADDIVKWNEACSLPECTFTAPEGYVFKAWSIDGVEYPVESDIFVTEDMTVTAVWESEIYTVSYKLGDGMGAIPPVEVTYGQVITLPEPDEPDESKVFDGWLLEGKKYFPGMTYTVTTDVTFVAQWKDRPVKITYENDAGETLWTDDTLSYGKNHQVLTLDGLNAKLTDDKKLTAPEGYEFGGWLLLNTANGIIGEANENDQLPVYSVWKIRANWVKKSVEYTLTLDMNGGDPLQGHTAYEGGYFELPTIEVINHPDGLEFDYFDIGDGNKYEAHEFIPATGNVTAVAHWKNAYTITFDANGGTGEMASVTVKEGSEYTLPECAFTKSMMRFKAWSYQGQEYAPGQKITVTQNDTVTALWQQVCVVSFEANGGEGEMASVTVDMGATIVLPECSFTKTGHTFAGWTYEETLQPGASLTVNTDMSILAVWNRNPCVLTFKPGEGTGEVKTYDMLYGDGVELRDPSVHGFSYEGHECVGWTDGTNTYTLGTFLDVEKDVTYTALWKKLSYTITFEGEQGSMASVTKEYGDTYVLPECGFQAPINNEFKAWDVNGTEYQVGASITVTGNVTVKPVWQWIEYTVTFDAQGGTGTMEPVTVLAGTDFTVPVCTFEAPEFKLFSAWVVDDEIVGGRYKAGDVITVYNDITLNAGWMNSEYKITYKSSAADDAEIYEDPIVGGSAYTLMNNMFTAPEGKMFRCWLFPVPPTFTETEELDPGTPFSRVGSNLTFIADWEPLKYIVSFDGNGGSGSMEAVVVEHGGEFTIPESGFTAPTGMVFSGWKLDGEAKKPGDSLIVTGGVTLTAQWAPMELAVSFDPGDRGGDSKTQTQLYGVKFNLPYLSDLGWDDYLSGSVFLGWNLNGEYLAEGAAFTATADTTLTAMWADRYYTITIKDSNESAAPTSVTVEYGDSYTLKSASAYGFRPKDSRIHVFDNWMRTSDQKTFAPGDTISGITRSMAFEAKWTFGTIVEVEDEETGEVVETVVEIEVTTQPEEIDQNDASVMNTSDPSKLPEQLGNMLAALQVNTAGAEAEGGVVIETMQDVVDALHESINGTVTTETEELEYPAENIAVTDIIPVLEIEIDGVVEKIEITDKSLMPDDTGIEVALEIPAGTDPATHQYKITHMLTQDAWDGSNKKAGDIETLTVHRYDEKYLYVMMKNFSPVAIAWKELPAEVIIPDVVIEELPQTGDPSSLLAWVTLLGASGIGLHAMKRRKK